MLTAERLRQILNYDPDTGAFTWRAKTGCKVVVGRQAGHVCATHGYVFIRIDKKLHRAHRLAFLCVNGRWPQDEIDHINGVRNDNRWSNLREATSSQNKQNTGMRSDNSSGFRGVYYYKPYGKWMALIGVDNRSKFLGYFDSPELAHEAYKAAAKEHFGQFARAS